MLAVYSHSLDVIAVLNVIRPLLMCRPLTSLTLVLCEQICITLVDVTHALDVAATAGHLVHNSSSLFLSLSLRT